MLYFRKNNKVIEKYLISFDKEKIEKLKNEIINKCSFINHIEYESEILPTFTNKIIRNYIDIPTGEVKMYFEETKDIYRFSYDEYEPPYLVELINQLLDGNLSAIDKILRYDISSKSNIDDRINLANIEFNNINLENIALRKAKLEELDKLYKLKELNKDQQSVELYYNQLIGLISFNLIDSLSISELDRIESFFETELANKLIDSNSKINLVVKSLKKID